MTVVSVILPTFGRKNNFREALENLCEQDFQDFEVVVVDDNPPGSVERDFIEDSVKKFNSDLDVLHIQRGSEQGLASARNNGIEQSSGDYIAFLDDDDRWKPEKLMKQIESLEKSGFEGCYTSYVMVSEDDHPDHIVEVFKDVVSLSDILKENIVGSPSSVMMQKDCLEEVGMFRNDMDGAEEWDLWARFVKNGFKFKALNEPLTLYRKGNDSMASHSDIITPGREKFTENFKEHIESDINVAARHYLTRGIEQFEFKNFPKSQKYLLKSLSFKKINWKAYIFLIGIFIERYTGFELINRLVNFKHRFE